MREKIPRRPIHGLDPARAVLELGDKPRTVGRLMRLVLAVAVALGVLRSPLGEIAALIAGGVVGCGLAPWFACRGMHSLDRALCRVRGPLSPLDPLARRRASLLAQSYILIWTAWFFAGVVVAATGMVLARCLRP
jgi:hypothetical protein